MPEPSPTPAAPGLEAPARVDFLVVGAQKCATSWLFLCLQDHPGVHTPSGKREREYVGGAEYREKGPAWWFARFDGASPEQSVGDVSVDYLVDPDAARTVLEIAGPDLKVVASLRDPVARALSAQGWYHRRDIISEGDPEAALRQAVDDDRAGLDTPHAEMLRRSRYAEDLGRWVEAFGPENVLVSLYEDVAADPQAVLRRIYGFVGADPDFVPPSLGVRPKVNTRSKAIVALERLAPRSYKWSFVGNVMHRLAARLGIGTGTPDLSPALRADLHERFDESVRGLEALLERLPPENRPPRPVREVWSV